MALKDLTPQGLPPKFDRMFWMELGAPATPHAVYPEGSSATRRHLPY